jgi:hypothetical protein
MSQSNNEYLTHVSHIALHVPIMIRWLCDLSTSRVNLGQHLTLSVEILRFLVRRSIPSVIRQKKCGFPVSSYKNLGRVGRF